MDRAPAKPLLLFNDECAVCRLIGHWVQRSAADSQGNTSIDVRPIGTDPVVLRALNPKLDIWDAYAKIHLLMPDRTMKLDGEAVAETLRRLRLTAWLARSFNVRVFGGRPFQALLNGAYRVLADLRPLLGCESCGVPPPWLRPVHWVVQWVKGRNRSRHHTITARYLATRSPSKLT